MGGTARGIGDVVFSGRRSFSLLVLHKENEPMKIRIANVLDGAAHALLVAGTLGIPAAVCADPVPHPSREKPAAVSPGALEARPLSQMAKYPRVLEMQVALAWLADPVASPCRLEARTVGGSLEVRGEVPDEAALGHALQLARVESGMQVVSKLQINPRLRAPAGRKTQDVLHRDAFNALRQGFPDLAPAITVSTLADGQIVLKGTVQFFEDKLAISRHLRQATTCSCIMNQLQVLAEPPEGLAQGSWRAAAPTLLPPEALQPQSVQPVAHMPHPETAPPASAAHAPHSSVDTTAAGGSSSALRVSARRSEEPSSPPSAVQAAAPSLHPAPEKQSATAANPTAKPLVYRTKWRRMDPSEIALPKNVAPVVVPNESASAKMPVAPATPPKPTQTILRVIPGPNEDPDTHSGGTAVTKAETAPAPKQLPQLRPNSIQTVASAADSPGARSQQPIMHAANSPPAPMPAARPPASSVAKKDAYVSEGVIFVASAVKPASSSAPAKGEKPPLPFKPRPYVTNGVILFGESANEERVHPNPALAALQNHLQQRIAAVCGKSSKDIEVTAVSETEVAVRVKAYSTLEGEELSNRIFQLPELGPCQVSLDVVLMK
jgi:hypothetical protein